MALVTENWPRRPEIDISGWHSRLQALYHYWQSIHPVAGLPGRKSLDPTAIPTLLPSIWLLDVQRKPFRLKYRLVGTHIVQLVGDDPTGRWLDEAHPHLAEDPSPLERYREVASTGAPSHRRGKPMIFLTHTADYTEIESAIFPLAQDGRTIDTLLCCTIFYRLDGSEF